MIRAIVGLHGTGKTYVLVHVFGFPAWKAGRNIISYNQLYFDNTCEPDNQPRIKRFWQQSDLYTASDALILFPEMQKLLNDRFLPPMFLDLVAQHRHSQLDIIGDTQDLMQISLDMRRHIAEIYVCQTILRLPGAESILPFIHWIRVQKKVRRFDTTNNQVLFIKEGRAKWYFISRFWTKKLYDTFEKSQLTKFVCWVSKRKESWIVHLINRRLIRAQRRKKN